MRFVGLVVGAIVAATAGVGCGGSGDSGSFTPQIVTLKYAGPCEAGRQVECACPGGAQGAQVCKEDGSAWGTCEGCPAAMGTGGAGGSGTTTNSTATSGAGGDESTSTSATSGSTSSSDSSTSSSSAGGTGGGMACVPTKCDPKVTCGDFDDGCGTVLHCGGCEDGQGNPNLFLTCDLVKHICQCQSAAGNAEAVSACMDVGGGTPLFCGPPSPKSAANDCNSGGQTSTGQPIACCL